MRKQIFLIVLVFFALTLMPLARATTWWQGNQPSLYYQFENNLNDNSGNGYSLTPGSANSFSNTIHKIGNYSRIYGATAPDTNSNPYVAFGANNFTIAFWMNYSGSSSDIMQTGTGYLPNDAWAVRFYNSRVNFETQGSIDPVYSQTGLNDGQWHRIVITRNGTGTNGMHMYVDGVDFRGQAVGTETINFGETTFEMGGDHEATVFNGYLDEVLIYNGVVWNASDVAYDYNGGAGRSAISPFFLVPLNNSGYNTNTVILNGTVAATTGSLTLVNMSFWSNQSGTFNKLNTQTVTGTTNSTVYTNVFPGGGVYLWGIQACYSDNSCAFSYNNTLIIDTIKPVVNILYPNGIIQYGYIGMNTTLNFSVGTEFNNPNSCWYSYGSINTTINCSQNSSFILGTQSNLTLYANDSGGNIANSTANWNYTVFQNNQIYSPGTTEGSIQTFILNASMPSYTGYTNLVYNGTNYSATSSVDSGGNQIFSVTLNVPVVSSLTNYSFYWQINNNGYMVNTPALNQTVYLINLDNCQTYTNNLANFFLYDQDTLANLNGAIQLLLQLYAQGTNNLITVYNATYTNANTAKVCIQSLNQSYTMNYQVVYSNASYATQYYYGQEIKINNQTIPQNVSLYDLNSSESTAFSIIVQGSNLLDLPGAIVQVQRQYPALNQFITVEAPLTDANGIALTHLTLGTNVYNFLVYQNGILLGTFPGYVAQCTGTTCQYTLNIAGASPIIPSFQNFGGMAYSINYSSSNNRITMPFYSVDGNVHTISWDVVLNDGYGNNSICYNSVTTTSGTFICNIPVQYGNASLIVDPTVDGNFTGRLFLSIGQVGQQFGGTGTVLGFLMYCTLVMLFIADPIMIVIGSVLGVVLAASFFLLSGGSILGEGAVAVWFLIAAGIVIWQITKAGRGH